MKLAKAITSFSLLLFVPTFAVIATAQQAEDISLMAPDGTTVSVDRDSYGVPHITAETEAGVFFGQGFAVAQDRLVQMERFRHAAEGRLSEWLGISFLENDIAIRTMFYTAQERMEQFAQLPAEIQAVMEAYSAGVNAFLDSMAANPAQFKPFDFHIFPHQVEPWTVYNTVAVIQFFTRIFGQAGGDELLRLQELQDNGQAWLDNNRPINDPTAPTTIHATSTTAAKTWHYSGMRVRDEVIQSIKGRDREINAKYVEVGVPLKFGSFAVLISPAKSGTGNVMLLGAPQMGPPKVDETNITNEVELNCPTLHVGGMTIAGIPLAIIGHNDHQAWTLTSGISDNSDVYIETTMDASLTKYWHNSEWRDFQEIEEVIKTPTGGEIPVKHYRTVHGPVFADDLANKQAFSMKMSFWNQELDMVVAFYNMIKTNNLQDFEAAAAMNPFSFNLFYAGQDQQIKYWHVGKYQDRSDGVDPRLPHKGDGSEEWGGFIPFSELPHADLNDQDYFVNWNNKPVNWWNNGDNIPWAGSTGLTTRVLAIESFVGPLAGFTHENLKDVPSQINDHGTYQQAIELTGTGFNDENIIPPGQSEFVNINAVPSPHKSDQWSLHENWQFKDMEFGPSLVAVSVDPEKEIPRTFALHQNYPNPFNPETTIVYELPEAGNVTLDIFNIQGRLVQTLVNGFQTAGAHRVQWKAANLSSGVYVYRIKAGSFSAVRKSALLK